MSRVQRLGTTPTLRPAWGGRYGRGKRPARQRRAASGEGLARAPGGSRHGEGASTTGSGRPGAERRSTWCNTAPATQSSRRRAPGGTSDSGEPARAIWVLSTSGWRPSAAECVRTAAGGRELRGTKSDEGKVEGGEGCSLEEKGQTTSSGAELRQANTQRPSSRLDIYVWMHTPGRFASGSQLLRSSNAPEQSRSRSKANQAPIGKFTGLSDCVVPDSAAVPYRSPAYAIVSPQRCARCAAARQWMCVCVCDAAPHCGSS